MGTHDSYAALGVSEDAAAERGRTKRHGAASHEHIVWYAVASSSSLLASMGIYATSYCICGYSVQHSAAADPIVQLWGSAPASLYKDS